MAEGQEEQIKAAKGNERSLSPALSLEDEDICCVFLPKTRIIYKGHQWRMEERLPVSTFQKAPGAPTAPITTPNPCNSTTPQTSKFASLPFRLPCLFSLAVLGVGEMLGFFFFAIYQQIVWS